MEIEVSYGSSKLSAIVPKENVLDVLEPKSSLASSDNLIEGAITSPVSAAMPTSLSGRRVAIVVDDHTRSTPTRKMILPILRKLEAAGCRDADITVIFACGIHRSVRQEEAEAMLGRDLLERYRVISHDSRSHDLVEVGITPTYGNVLSINREYFESDYKILTGDIELHYYAGYGGGRKSILPGVSSESAILRNHSMLYDPRARIGNLDGNPVHIDMTEGAKLAGSDFTVNVVKDAAGGIAGAYAGKAEEVLARGAKLVDEIYKVPIQRRADVVIVGAGGSDIDFYQAYKAMHTALNALRFGGKLIVAAECRDGPGNDIFYDWIQRYSRAQDVEKALGGRFILGAHKAYLLLKAVAAFRIAIVTGMDRSLVRRMKVEYASGIQTAIDEELRSNPGAKVYVIPWGGRTLPFEA